MHNSKLKMPLYLVTISLIHKIYTTDWYKTEFIYISFKDTLGLIQSGETNTPQIST